MTKMMKLAVISTAAMLTSACAITEMVALTGLSYVLTGKSVSDNALSVVTNMDCAAHNLLSGDAICLDKEQSLLDDSFLAFAPIDEFNYEAPLLPVQFKDRPNDYDNQASTYVEKRFDSQPDTPTGSEAASHIETSTTSKQGTDEKIYAVVGSFETMQNAVDRKEIFQSYAPKISKGVSNKRTLYRVVIGPLSDREEIARLPSFDNIDKTPSWIITLCGDNLAEMPCSKG